MEPFEEFLDINNHFELGELEPLEFKPAVIDIPQLPMVQVWQDECEGLLTRPGSVSSESVLTDLGTISGSEFEAPSSKPNTRSKSTKIKKRSQLARRRERNRIAAQRSRQRKIDRISELESENEQLLVKIADLERENERLLIKMAELESRVQSKTISHSY